MLKCREVVAQSTGYIEAELDLRERISMRLHLLMCRHCRRFIRHMKISVKFFQGLPLASLSQEEAEGIVRIVAKRT